jgi:hypothetical protein
MSEVFARPAPRADLNKIGFRTAESIWARQVASQKTSFAIAGSGAMQSDFAPVLEYDAPRAFYEQQSALEIFIYDERMMQAAFAPDEKQKALMSLSTENLHQVFANYGSANSTLMQYVSWRVQMGTLATAEHVYPAQPLLEFIFRAPVSYPRTIELPQNASSEMRQFVAAQGLLLQPKEWRAGVTQIEALLTNYNPDRYEEGKLNPRPGLFAAAAIRICLARGEHALAERLISKALELEPEDVQLRYLHKLLERQSKTIRLAQQ